MSGKSSAVTTAFTPVSFNALLASIEKSVAGSLTGETGIGELRAILDYAKRFNVTGITRDKEYDLMCPANPIGIVDIFDASNHGTNNANAAVLLHAVEPQQHVGRDSKVEAQRSAILALYSLFSAGGSQVTKLRVRRAESIEGVPKRLRLALRNAGVVY